MNTLHLGASNFIHELIESLANEVFTNHVLSRAYGSIIYFEKSRLLRMSACTDWKFQEDTQ